MLHNCSVNSCRGSSLPFNDQLLVTLEPPAPSLHVKAWSGLVWSGPLAGLAPQAWTLQDYQHKIGSLNFLPWQSRAYLKLDWEPASGGVWKVMQYTALLSIHVLLSLNIITISIIKIEE